MQMASTGSGRMMGTLGHWGKKRLCFLESGLYILPFLLLLFKKIFIIFCGESVSFMLIVSDLS